jgi:hypothetical protein
MRIRNCGGEARTRNRDRAESGLSGVSTRRTDTVTQRVQVTTVSQHGHAGRVRPPHQKAPAAKRGAKAAGVFGERANVAKFAKPPDWGGWKNRSTQLQYRGNLRGKRSDPSREVNALITSVAALAKNGGDAIAPDCRRVSTMSGELSSADGGRTGLRGLTQ